VDLSNYSWRIHTNKKMGKLLFSYQSRSLAGFASSVGLTVEKNKHGYVSTLKGQTHKPDEPITKLTLAQNWHSLGRDISSAGNQQSVSH